MIELLKLGENPNLREFIKSKDNARKLLKVYHDGLTVDGYDSKEHALIVKERDAVDYGVNNFNGIDFSLTTPNVVDPNKSTKLMIYFYPFDIDVEIDNRITATERYTSNGMYSMNKNTIPNLYILRPYDNYLFNGSFYRNTIVNDFDYESTMVELIKYYMTKLGIGQENVLLTGLSKGGYAALYYGLKMNLNAVISDAYVNLDRPYYPLKRYFKNSLLKFPHGMDELTNSFTISDNSINILTSHYNKENYPGLARIINPNVHLIDYPVKGLTTHGFTLKYLEDKGIYKRHIEDWLNDMDNTINYD